MRGTELVHRPNWAHRTTSPPPISDLAHLALIQPHSTHSGTHAAHGAYSRASGESRYTMYSTGPRVSATGTSQALHVEPVQHAPHAVWVHFGPQSSIMGQIQPVGYIFDTPDLELSCQLQIK